MDLRRATSALSAAMSANKPDCAAGGSAADAVGRDSRAKVQTTTPATNAIATGRGLFVDMGWTFRSRRWLGEDGDWKRYRQLPDLRGGSVCLAVQFRADLRAVACFCASPSDWKRTQSRRGFS